MRSGLTALIGASMLMPAGVAMAQASGGSAAGSGVADSLIIDQQRSDRAPVLPATPRPDLQANPSSAIVSAEPAAQTQIRSVRIEGSSLPPETLEAGWEPYIGQGLTTQSLQAMADALSQVYQASDVALFTVSIPSQDFAGGGVRIEVTEGLVGQVAIKGDVKTRHLRLIQAYSAKIARETPLRRQTLERYLSLIRDIPGLEVEPSLQPTGLQGVSLLVLDIKRERFDGELTLSDRGTPRLGRVQAQGRVVINNLFRQGDQTQLIVAAPAEIDPFQYASISHAALVGDEGLRVTGRAGYLRTRPKDSPIEGQAVTAGVEIAYPLRRSFSENLYLTAAVDLQDSDNAAFGQAISSDHTRAVRLGGSWSQVQARRSTSLSMTASFGLDALGASSDVRLTDADFTKLNLSTAHNRALSDHWVLRVRGAAQLSQGRLPASEQLALGGESYGRAFTSAYVTGDAGAAVVGELAWLGSFWPAPLLGSEIYGFADWGTVTYRARFDGRAPQAHYDLASGGAGVRLNVMQKTLFYVEGATALENPFSDKEAWRLLFGWRSQF